MFRLLSASLVAAAVGGAMPARADLQDEIQVYDDGIRAPKETGLELHVNTTPRGRAISNYPSEVPPQHALRVTPEFSMGLTHQLEAGLYLPTLLNVAGRYDLAGVKLRLKWLPVQSNEGLGAFAGVNFELSRLAYRYAESRTSVETRFIAGWRTADWLVAINPTLDFGLSDGFSGQRPDFNTGIKIARTVRQGLSAGVEYYTNSGPIGRHLPWNQQDNRLYLALDVDRKPWVFNLGIGRGLTHTADRWTLKAIFEIPL